MTTEERAIDVLLSTDVGAEVDDQWAIAHLVLSPRGKLLGIVIQNPLVIGEHEPVPDVAVVPGNPEEYRQAHPGTALL